MKAVRSCGSYWKEAHLGLEVATVTKLRASASVSLCC